MFWLKFSQLSQNLGIFFPSLAPSICFSISNFESPYAKFHQYRQNFTKYCKINQNFGNFETTFTANCSKLNNYFNKNSLHSHWNTLTDNPPETAHWSNFLEHKKYPNDLIISRNSIIQKLVKIVRAVL